MSTNLEMQRARVSRKGVQAGDIKHKGLLTDEQIADIPTTHVYEWVKTGAWKKRDFETWLRVMRVIE